MVLSKGLTTGVVCVVETAGAELFRNGGSDENAPPVLLVVGGGGRFVAVWIMSDDVDDPVPEELGLGLDSVFSFVL